MANYYDLEGIIKELDRRRVEAEAKRDLWLSVKRVAKKNGEDFKEVKRNFEGVTFYGIEAHSMGNFPILKIHGYNEVTHRYYEDSIQGYAYADDIEKGRANSIVDGSGVVCDNGSYVRDSYIYSLSELEAAMQHRIEYYNDYIESLKYQIKHAEKAYWSYYEALKKAADKLKKEANYMAEGCTHNDLFYAVREVVNKMYL